MKHQHMTKNPQYAIFSFFSGSGLLDLGFEKSGFTVVFVNEFFPPFVRAYEYARQKLGIEPPKFGYCNTDISEYLSVRKRELKNAIKVCKDDGYVVGFIGGPPCPDFSVAGKNKGQHGENGKLSQTYVDLICEMKPDFFLFENVKGLWRTARHRTFYETLKDKLRWSGYCTTERLTNSIEYGVPQDRDRILLFGLRSSLLPHKHKADNEILDFPWTANAKYSTNEVFAMPWPNNNDFSVDCKLPMPSAIDVELTVEYWFDKNNVLSHTNGANHFLPRQGIDKMRIITEGDVSKKSYKRLHRWRYSPTAAYGNNEVHLHPYKERRISAAEAMAIQSLPKDFVLPPDMSLSNMFKTIGNGVPFLLSVGIAKTIRGYLEKVLWNE
jgi:DNA (cytosine-5)-methyltransferase 1